MDIDKLILSFYGKVKIQNNQHGIEGEEQTWRSDRTQILDLL